MIARDRSHVIAMQGIVKTYRMGEHNVHALAGVDLRIVNGDHVAIMGASGSGKTTLMNIIGCLDAPTKGGYQLDGINIAALDERRLAIARNRKIGFIFQSFNLIPRTSALRNVELPMSYAGVERSQRRKRAEFALDRVGLSDRMEHLPSELSGGQQQRVAIARAIATDPALILADEPTGALDSRSTAEVLDIFDELSAAGRSLVVITHEDEVAERAARVIRLRDGLIVDDVRNRPVRNRPVRNQPVRTTSNPIRTSVGGPPGTRRSATQVA